MDACCIDLTREMRFLLQLQLDKVEMQLKECEAGRSAAEESAELMREKAESAEAKIAELRSELRTASAKAAEEVRELHSFKKPLLPQFTSLPLFSVADSCFEAFTG
jgi:predicted  nucleic acid-binding Zn-ribbon protein